MVGSRRKEKDGAGFVSHDTILFAVLGEPKTLVLYCVDNRRLCVIIALLAHRFSSNDVLILAKISLETKNDF